MAEHEEQLKSLLMKVKMESEKVGLKLNIPKTKIVASGPITSRQINGEKVETMADFIFLCSEITADGDWEPEESTVSICGCWVRLLRVLWTARKSNQSILKEINSEINKTMQMTTPLWQKAKKRWRAAWWKWKKEEGEKVGLKLNIQKTKIMASGPIPSWEIDGETVETVSDFILGGSKITADGDCSHEIKRRLLLGRKAMTNIDSILK